MVSQLKQSEIFGEVKTVGMGHKVNKMSLGHVAIPENKRAIKILFESCE